MDVNLTPSIQQTYELSIKSACICTIMRACLKTGNLYMTSIYRRLMHVVYGSLHY